MKTQITPWGISLWLSANETDNWAHRPRNSWPCSQLAGRRVFAQFDRNGLCDLAIDGGRGEQDCDANELSALCADHLVGRVPVDHPCFAVAVRQFLSDARRAKCDSEERALWSAGLHAGQTGGRNAHRRVAP